MKRQRVTRSDGKAINLVQRRGHLSYCYNACCCGRVDRGYAPVPVELYKSEWLRRKLRNVVHMTKGGCLGPCTLPNVVTLLFDGHSIWFHSINNDWQIVAIFDYIDKKVKADRYLVLARRIWRNMCFISILWKGSRNSYHWRASCIAIGRDRVFDACGHRLAHAEPDYAALAR
ncbi:hypothetical protein PEC18_08900 [Paucibacter sp. O1-1]|nr:hypothetical protein [Paucibacter sp. O1-1]MDA3825979.1 hypothetical protein [Paucibacter sp. O1-1]